MTYSPTDCSGYKFYKHFAPVLLSAHHFCRPTAVTEGCEAVFAIIIILVVLIDQFSKLAVVAKLAGNPPFVIIDGVFELLYHENKGAFLGSFSDNRWVFMIISTAAIIAMLVYLILNRKSDRLLTVALSFLIGGGIGNMIDRIRLGYVVDFLYAKFIDFPVFNIADSFITVGAGLLIIYMIRLEIAERKAKKARSDSCREDISKDNDK